mmetsp:Transcript_109997/g.206174  ORF Transcript_109997/g.206174 Transcript_109997/m.206174 type:complete len:487 (-) Transcript_109997:128-1588(-)
MDFLAPRSSKLQSSHGIDLPMLLGSFLGPPFPTMCSEIAGLLGAARAQRVELSKCIRKLLFGDGGSRDTDDGSTPAQLPREPLDFLFGGCKVPIEGAPHGKLTCSRKLGKELHFETAGLRELPRGPAAPQELPPSLGHSYGDAWLGALHLVTEPDTNEIQLTWAMGSHANLVPLLLDVISGITTSLGLVASGCSDTDQLGAAYRKSFPHLTAFYQRFFRLEEARISVEGGRCAGEPARLSFDFPFDFVMMQTHYDRLAELLRHFERLAFSVHHPEQAGLLLLEVQIQDGHLNATLAARDGHLAWWSTDAGLAAPRRPGEGEVIAWSTDGTFTVDLVVDIKMNLLGLEGLALPLPVLRNRCTFEKNPDGPGGSLSTSCIEVGEAPFELLTSCIVDCKRFRELVLERLCFQSAHRRADSDGDAWLVSSFLRIPFPTSMFTTTLMSYFKDLIARQTQEMQGLGAVHDFFEALGKDALAMSRSGATVECS